MVKKLKEEFPVLRYASLEGDGDEAVCKAFLLLSDKRSCVVMGDDAVILYRMVGPKLAELAESPVLKEKSLEAANLATMLDKLLCDVNDFYYQLPSVNDSGFPLRMRYSEEGENENE